LAKLNARGPCDLLHECGALRCAEASASEDSNRGSPKPGSLSAAVSGCIQLAQCLPSCVRACIRHAGQRLRSGLVGGGLLVLGGEACTGEALSRLSGAGADASLKVTDLVAELLSAAGHELSKRDNLSNTDGGLVNWGDL
jgi:hypothetical protein